VGGRRGVAMRQKMVCGMQGMLFLACEATRMREMRKQIHNGREDEAGWWREGIGRKKGETEEAELWMSSQKSISFGSKQNTLSQQRAQSVRHRPQCHVTQEKGERRGNGRECRGGGVHDHAG
jgi:hypothetical protein